MNTQTPENPRTTSWSASLTAIALDVVLPLAIYYVARAIGADPWLAVVVAALSPAANVALTWSRSRRLDPTGVFVIGALVLSLVVALFTGDERALMARESWITAAIGLWIIGSLATSRPFLLDVARKTSPPQMTHRYDQLWEGNAVFRRWMTLASIVWGLAFLIDAIARVVLAYTAPLDLVPITGVLVLVGLLVIGHGFVMLQAYRWKVLKLLKSPAEVTGPGPASGVRS
ncbi:VC0807 family protein [Actinoplanes sp. NPDC024001]|uniref:VC0807 family protein n=1 Tax=Actinoplanes sp. NPDC024001 TaxID=3154598 RepID=UPI00340EFACE